MAKGHQRHSGDGIASSILKGELCRLFIVGTRILLHHAGVRTSVRSASASIIGSAGTRVGRLLRVRKVGSRFACRRRSVISTNRLHEV